MNAKQIVLLIAVLVTLQAVDATFDQPKDGVYSGFLAPGLIAVEASFSKFFATIFESYPELKGCPAHVALNPLYDQGFSRLR